MIYSKKGIFEIISTILIIAITIIVGVGFFFFATSYLEDNQNIISSQSVIGDVTLQALSTNNLYITSEQHLNLTYLKVFDSKNNEMCSFEGNVNISDEGLVAWWTFDEIINDSGTLTLLDETGNGYDGIIKQGYVVNITNRTDNELQLEFNKNSNGFIDYENCLLTQNANDFLIMNDTSFEEGRNITINDSLNIELGLGNITCGSLPKSKSSRLGNSLLFDGKDDYVIIDSSFNSFTNNLETFSIVSYFKSDVFEDRYEVLLKSLNKKPDDTFFGIDLFRKSYGPSIVSRDNHLLSLRDFNNSNFVVSGNFNIENKYSNLITIADNSTNNSGRIYFQGKKMTTSIEKNESPFNFTSLEYPLTLAAGNSRGIIKNFFKGEIDEIRIYNRTLSEEEIKQLYWYSIKNQLSGSSQIDLTSCNLKPRNRYRVEMLLEDGSKISKTLNG
ncbi:MAG: LamG-like jellyroll fold domain-containing protein [Candidatus Nanoarchaeia archaeon]